MTQPLTQRRQQSRKQAIDWLLRLEDGELSPSERVRFNTWLDQDPLNRSAFEKAQSLLGQSRTALAADPEATRQALEVGSRTPIIGAVAVLALAVSATIWLADVPMRLVADDMTSPGELRSITLVDGSRVLLNGRSSIAYNFGSERREVSLLRGEAYFKVASDPARPFTVKAGGGEIRVLGTAFNVNLGSAATEVTVAEHVVEVSGEGGTERISLTPGNQLRYDPDGHLGPVSLVDAAAETSWRNRRLVFEDRPLGQVMEELARHLPGQVVVVGSALRARAISGTFDLTKPDEALASFAQAFGLRTARAGPFVTLIY
ncbi:FecR family protein [Aureimonas altamirensis]|uniref:FecR family protein n=1 Tax=Aureimonas altamirensis TaxID=370622 RepID=UPI001E5E7106|nr:FecR family protein [Aureimonas altamirensis]UHD46333.1 FecR family protein [Aureimonas altamirensis]